MFGIINSRNPSLSCAVDSHKYLRRDFRAEQTEKAILAQKVVIEETLAEWKFSHPEFADCDGNPDIKLSMRNERNSAMSKIRYLRKSLEKKNKNILSDNL